MVVVLSWFLNLSGTRIFSNHWPRKSVLDVIVGTIITINDNLGDK